MIHKYCKLCGLCRPGEPGCHGRKFKNFQVRTVRDGLNGKAYVPLSLEEKLYRLELIYGRRARSILPMDANSPQITLAVLDYSGKGSRMTLVGIHYWSAEIGQVGKLFTDIYLKECLDDPTLKPHPIRCRREGRRIYVIS